MARFFVECDQNGKIVWQDDYARARLGPDGNLLDSVEMEDPAVMRDWLQQRGAPDAVARMKRSGGQSVPVEFRRVMELPTRVLIAVFEREAAGDILHHAIPELGQLVSLQWSVLSHYFRLQQVHEVLNRHREEVGKRVRVSLVEEIERERARLASELHTGAGQMLAGIKLHLELIDSALPDPPDAVRNSLHKIGLLAQGGLNQVRAISQQLHPPDWQNLTLAQAIEHLWNITGIPQSYEAILDLRPLDPEPPQGVRMVLYRSAQEALANIIRHAQAKEIRLSLRQTDGQVVLEIEDNGVGFDPEQLLSGGNLKHSGIGLLSMREHVRGLGGELAIESRPGNTSITIAFPITVPND